MGSPRLGLEPLREYAASRGGQCLSTVYTNNRVKCQWECSCGYRWEASCSIIYNKSWCPKCAGMARLSILTLQELAQKRGGKCLSTEYTNNGAKYQWECSCGYRWLATARDVKCSGSWCPKCAGIFPLGMQKLYEFAAKKGGRCLSTVYTNASQKYQWECSCGYQWLATAASVVCSGRWCHKCAGTIKLTLNFLQKIAESRGGRCLSSEYVRANDPLLWVCKDGHQWPATANNILNANSWCPRCAGLAPHDLQWLHKLATEKGGRCLSVEYLGNKSRYQWECSKGHQWETSAHNIQQGQWCSYCSLQASKPEESLFLYVQTKFPDAVRRKKRILRNKKFELDIYVPSIKKAIEFDGWFWHKSPWALKQGSEEREARKDLQCLEVGIQLLRVTDRDYLKDPEGVKQKVLNFLSSP
jgi:hypothetical protein